MSRVLLSRALLGWWGLAAGALSVLGGTEPGVQAGERLAESAATRHRPARVEPEGASLPRDFVGHQTREVAGWTVHVSSRLLDDEAMATERALELLQMQLEQIVRNVPQAAAVELQKVRLWISPEYSGTQPRAEYHPDASWLGDNGRDVAMAKAIEFTNVRIFVEETRRMPNFALHELAHAYHDRVLADGFANHEIQAAYEKAKSSGKYDRVERWLGDGSPNTFERAYAMNDPMEYFAETTEAFFSRNDFYPFTRDELKQHDPGMAALLTKLWGVDPPKSARPQAP